MDQPPPPAARRFNIWVWLPVLVIAVAAIANGAMILTARHVRPERVEAQPWLGSAQLGRQSEAATAFAAAGWRWTVEPGADGALCRLAQGTSAPPRLTVRRYRPDDRALDATFAWDVPTQPLAVALPRPGAWRFLLLADGQPVAEAQLER